MLARWRAARDEFFASGNDPEHFRHLNSTNVIVVTRSTDHLLVCVRAIVSLCLFAVLVASESWCVCGVRVWSVVILFSLHPLLLLSKWFFTTHFGTAAALLLHLVVGAKKALCATRSGSCSDKDEPATVHTCTMRVEKVCKVREEPAPRFRLQLSGTRWDHTVWSVWPHPRPGTFGGFPKHSGASGGGGDTSWTLDGDEYHRLR